MGTYSIAPPPAASAAAATPPPNRNAASATTAAAASPTASAASAASAASVAAPPVSVSGKLYAGFGCSDIFLVEDIERRQTDISDFFFAESDFVARCGVLHRHIRCEHLGCRGAARQRQGQPGGSQQRHGACSMLSLRSLLRVRHGGVLPCFTNRLYEWALSYACAYGSDKYQIVRNYIDASRGEVSRRGFVALAC